MSQYVTRHGMPPRKYTHEQREQIRRKRTQTFMERYGGFPGHGSAAPMPQIRMIVTPWFTDPADGLETRVVRASE